MLAILSASPQLIMYTPLIFDRIIDHQPLDQTLFSLPIQPGHVGTTLDPNKHGPWKQTVQASPSLLEMSSTPTLSPFLPHRLLIYLCNSTPKGPGTDSDTTS